MLVTCFLKQHRDQTVTLVRLGRSFQGNKLGSWNTFEFESHYCDVLPNSSHLIIYFL